MDKSLKKRTGAKKISEVPKEILEQLHDGRLETVNLVESLAVDQFLVAKNLLTKIDREHYYQAIIANSEKLKSKTITHVTNCISATLLKEARDHNDLDQLLFYLSLSPSDIIRSWGATMIGLDDKLTLDKKLKKIYSYAEDPHFAVREMAWMAVRPDIAADIKKAIPILSKWAKDKNPNIRRFASEVTRPRGVWCRHIDELKQNPSLGLPILQLLKADPSEYVQLSVGNWLNDAGKSDPAWVKKLCKEWIKSSTNENTERIVKHGLRNL